MKIFIDADGCPVIRIAVRTAKEYNIPCIILCDTSHLIQYDDAETITVDKGADCVDFRLVSLIQKEDIAITQDYGLAAMCLAKKAAVLNQDGKQYTPDNICSLLEFRAVSAKIRKSGGRLKGLPKRTPEQDKAFASALKTLLKSR